MISTVGLVFKVSKLVGNVGKVNAIINMVIRVNEMVGNVFIFLCRLISVYN